MSGFMAKSRGVLFCKAPFEDLDQSPTTMILPVRRLLPNNLTEPQKYSGPGRMSCLMQPVRLPMT
ncbi:MAG: hypothetical protein ACO3VS_12470, partial [Limisphaerales bacterium]